MQKRRGREDKEAKRRREKVGSELAILWGIWYNKRERMHGGGSE